MLREINESEASNELYLKATAFFLNQAEKLEISVLKYQRMMVWPQAKIESIALEQSAFKKHFKDAHLANYRKSFERNNYCLGK